MMTNGNTRAPWHLWLVGLLALLFNGGAANDYLMLKTRNAAYRAALTEAQLAYYDSYPLWMDIAWATTVWFAVVGAVLLLVRQKLASSAFMVAFLAYLVALFHTYVVASPPPGLTSTSGNIFAVVMGLQLLALWYYANRVLAPVHG